MASRWHTKCRFHSRGGESAIAGNSVDEGEEQPGTTANCGCFFFVGGARWHGRGENHRGRNVLRSEADWSCEAGDLGPQCGERRKAFSRDLARVGGGIDGQRTPCRGGGGPYVGRKRRDALRAGPNIDKARKRDCRGGLRVASCRHGGMGNGCADHGGGCGIDQAGGTVRARVDARSRRPSLSGVLGGTKPQGTAKLFFLAGNRTKLCRGATRVRWSMMPRSNWPAGVRGRSSW